MDFSDISKPSKPEKILLRGPTGAGKTMQALRMATRLARGKDVAFLDSEAGRGKLFAGKYKFKYAELAGNYSPTKYVDAINSAIKAGFGAIVLDSLTQAWKGVGGVLDQVNSAGGSNKFTDGWGKIGTPLQIKFMDAIITCPIPVICTVRSKMSYEIEKNDNGKNVPRAIGLAPEQRDDVSYEFDYILDIDMDHHSIVTKMPPIEGISNTIGAGEYDEWIARVMEWMASGVLEPQTYTDIKMRLSGDEHRLALLTQLYKEKKSVAEAWAAIQTEPVAA